MNQFKITSDRGHIHFGPIYIGWNLVLQDELFGLSIGNFYVGCYPDGWCSGFLNEYGYLD